MTMILRSSAFTQGDEIPAKHTCVGEDISPPLSWQDLPEGTQSLALIVDDPDAPDPQAPKMTWVHWVAYNIPADATELAEGASKTHLPPGAQEGLNDWNKTGFNGPCPPIGRHRYFHKLYALDTRLEKIEQTNKLQLEAAMQGHILGTAELMGTFAKS